MKSKYIAIIILLLFVILVLPQTSLSFPLFDEPLVTATGEKAQSIAIGDLNGDGNLDSVIGRGPGFSVAVNLGNGDGTFQPTVFYPTAGSQPFSVALGDFDKNGTLDLTIANTGSNNIAVLLGNGDGTFRAAVTYIAPYGPLAVATEYLNSDNNLDLAVTNSSGRNVSVFLGNGDGTFQNASLYSTAIRNPYAIAIGDLNRDGYQDLVVTVTGEQHGIVVLVGDGEGAFQAASSYALDYASIPSSVAIADFDKNGDMDLAVTPSGSHNVSVFLGNGSGIFQTPITYVAGATPYSVATKDLDGDGNLDLAVANYHSLDVSVLLGNGDGTFQGAIGYPARSGGPRYVAIADLNNDDNPDLAVANTTGTISVFINQTLPAGQLTVTHPNGSEILYKGQNYTITWNSADVFGNILIHLYKGGTDPENFVISIAADDPNDGSYPFNPPDFLEDGSDYYIGISAEAGTIWDFSDSAFSIEAPNQPPILDSFKVDKDCDSDPLTVCFTCNAHDPDNDISLYIFDPGEGILKFSEENHITYTYYDFGTYETACTVVDEVGHETTSDLLKISLANPNANLYGLFVGQDSTNNLRGDLIAEEVYNNFSNLRNIRHKKLITDKYFPITQGQIERAINDIKKQIQPNDILILYIVGHGTVSTIFEDETTLTSGDEYIWLGDFVAGPFMLEDDELSTYLSGMDEIEKWVLVDSCHSGGFWGNHNLLDVGDLEKLGKISMVAASAEDKPMHYIIDPTHPDFGKTIFGLATRDAWSKTIEDHIISDLNRDGILTFDEFVFWLRRESPAYGGLLDGIVVAEGAFGDISVFNSDMWNPVPAASGDFVGIIITDSSNNLIANANGPYLGNAGFPITLNASGSYSPNEIIVLYEWDCDNDGIYDHSSSSPTITHTYSEIYNGTLVLRVTDNEGLTEIDSASVEVLDTTPPEITLTVKPDALWPPNHKMVPIAVSITATDNCDPSPVIQLESITMNEGDLTNAFDPNDDNAIGDGNTVSDIQVDVAGNISLRAERSGTGDGRIYTITYSVTDASGNTATASATITVPHNQ